MPDACIVSAVEYEVPGLCPYRKLVESKSLVTNEMVLNKRHNKYPQNTLHELNRFLILNRNSNDNDMDL